MGVPGVSWALLLVDVPPQEGSSGFLSLALSSVQEMLDLGQLGLSKCTTKTWPGSEGSGGNKNQLGKFKGF